MLSNGEQGTFKIFGKVLSKAQYYIALVGTTIVVSACILGVIFAATHQYSPSSPGEVPGEVSFVLQVAQYRDVWVDTYRDAIATVVDDGDTGNSITRSDVVIRRAGRRLQSHRRRLLQDLPSQATLDVTVRVPAIEDVSLVYDLFASGPARADFVDKLRGNLTEAGLEGFTDDISVRPGASTTPTAAPTIAPTLQTCNVVIANIPASSPATDRNGIYNWRGPEKNYESRPTYECSNCPAPETPSFIYYSRSGWGIAANIGAEGGDILLDAGDGENVGRPELVRPGSWSDSTGPQGAVTSVCEAGQP
jgi:hypothetical protein